jgi:FlaA1/EpsC-like NDP-sugar epimerase
MQTIILGKKSFLSSELKKKIDNSLIFNIEEFISIYKKKFFKKKINIIINSFYPSSQLRNINTFSDFTKKSISDLAKLLDCLNKNKINKVIFTSSSAVYGIKVDNNFNEFSSRSLYATYKLACEELIKNFYAKVKNKNNFIIARVFNIYGSKENFSIISKLKKIANPKSNIGKLKIYNYGKSIRDFINIKDVAIIYKKLLINKFSGIIDIGTGRGVKIFDIIKYLGLEKKIKFISSINEDNYSIANTLNLKSNLQIGNFYKLEKFFSKNYKKKAIASLDYIDKNSSGIVIYGCGYSGIKIANQIKKSRLSKVRFFIDDDPNKIGKIISGIKVISFSQMKIIAYKNKISKLIIAIPSITEEQNFKLLEKLSPYCNFIESLPRKKYFKNKDVDIRDLEKILTEEILNRKIFSISSNILKNFKSKTILITGGAGSIGSEISRQLLISNPKRVIVLDHSEFGIYKLDKEINDKKIKFIIGDIKDESFISKLIRIEKVDYIFHCAAYKHVKFLEENIISAIKNNVFGTYSILKAIKNTKINATFISTDKAVNPTNVLGISKRIAEILVQIIAKSDLYKNCKISIVRFGNVLGSDGSAIPTFIDQIKNNQEVTITDFKMKRFFMSIKEACSLVIKASQIKANNKIFVLKMGKQIKIIDIINKIFKLYKTDKQVLKIKKIGNFGNEKVSEKLTSAKSINSSPVKRIFIANEVIPKNELFFNFIDKLNIAIENNQISNLKKLLKNFKW